MVLFPKLAVLEMALLQLVQIPLAVKLLVSLWAEEDRAIMFVRKCYATLYA